MGKTEEGNLIMDLNAFVTAIREKYRFSSARGELVLEQLWALPLTSNSGFSLDDIARDIARQLRESGEESFVPNGVVNKARALLQAKLDIVKYVIDTKLAENAAQRAKLEKQEKRARLLDALRTKEDQEITAASKEDLLKQLAALDE
jgi:hypothetical protein